MSLVYGVEKLDRCWNELMVIASQHWNETEGFRRGEPFAPSFSRYAECERIGFFTMFTARDGEKLVGYAGMYTTQSMHSQVTIAVEDQWFLLPEYRKGRNALAFVRYVEWFLSMRGVRAIQMSAKLANGAGRILEYLDYQAVSTVYFKSLDRADSAQDQPAVMLENADVRAQPAPAA